MKKFIINFLVFCLAYKTSTGQDVYTLAKVPEAIKNKATIVTHYENIDLEIESIEKATIKIDKIFTVLNDEGRDALVFNQYSSKNISLEDAEIRVFDANGKQTAKYKKKDMSTVATGEGLIEDGYVTHYYVRGADYPITLEFKYEIKIKGTLNIPAYRFLDAKEGIVESNYTARVPATLSLRYKAKNTRIQPAITDEGKYKVYRWNVRNISPMEYEQGAVDISRRYPHIMFASDKFSYYGMEGDLSSWKSFGSWIGNLYNGLDVLPPERQQFFQQLVKNAPDEKEKIKQIYNYLQQNFRYVSIQLGVGGLKPFPADFTDKKKYGDCKGLSNYMKAALKSVGIKSYVAIINAEFNDEPVDPDFPTNDFNHVILCIPGSKDSTWLECTSSTTEFGELGTFTENRYALLITEDGGALVPTPKSVSSANTLSTTTRVTLSNDLSALTETIFTAKGQYREIIRDIMSEKKDEQKKAIVLYFGFKQPDYFELSKDESSPSNKTKLKMALRKVPDFNAGNKLFISPRMYKIWSSVLPKAENRSLDFYFNFPFEKNDTTIIKLPADMKPDALPKEAEIKCNYALYRSKYWYDEKHNEVYAATVLILKQHRIPAAEYAQVKKFFDDILQDDSQKLVVKKEDTEKKAF